MNIIIYRISKFIILFFHLTKMKNISNHFSVALKTLSNIKLKLKLSNKPLINREDKTYSCTLLFCTKLLLVFPQLFIIEKCSIIVFDKQFTRNQRVLYDLPRLEIAPHYSPRESSRVDYKQESFILECFELNCDVSIKNF